MILGSVVWLYLFIFPSPPPIDPRPHRGLGEAMAAEALKLMAGDGRLIVIIRDSDSFIQPATEAQLEGFRKAIEAAGNKIHTTRAIKVDPLRVVSVPPGDFYEILRQAKDSDVIVSFLGLPNFGADHLAKLGTKRCPTVALCSGMMPARIDLKGAFQQKLLHAAIVSRPDAPAKASAGDARAAFAQMFKVITPSNLSDLASLNESASAN